MSAIPLDTLLSEMEADPDMKLALDQVKGTINLDDLEITELRPPYIHPASWRLGSWLSAALDDPNVCAEMKADIEAWFEADSPLPRLTEEPK